MAVPTVSPTPQPTRFTPFRYHRQWSTKDLTLQGLLFLGVIIGIACLKLTLKLILQRVRAPPRPLISNEETDINTTGVTKEAGLIGITLSERICILEKILKSQSYSKQLSGLKDAQKFSKKEEACDIETDSRIKSMESKPNEETSDDINLEGINCIRENSSENPDNLNEEKENGSIENIPHNTVDTLPSFHNNKAVSEKIKKKSSNSSDLSSESDDEYNPYNCCAICMEDYEEGEEVIIGDPCCHMFHKECLFEWLRKHDVCPFCRNEMMTPTQMWEAAQVILGQKRFTEVSNINARFTSQINAISLNLPDVSEFQSERNDDRDAAENAPSNLSGRLSDSNDRRVRFSHPGLIVQEQQAWESRQEA